MPPEEPWAPLRRQAGPSMYFSGHRSLVGGPAEADGTPPRVPTDPFGRVQPPGFTTAAARGVHASTGPKAVTGPDQGARCLTTGIVIPCRCADATTHSTARRWVCPAATEGGRRIAVKVYGQRIPEAGYPRCQETPASTTAPPDS
jgi:hypothetical protein